MSISTQGAQRRTGTNLTWLLTVVEPMRLSTCFLVLVAESLLVYSDHFDETRCANKALGMVRALHGKLVGMIDAFYEAEQTV